MGAATARVFAAEGAMLTLVDLKAGLLDDLAASLRSEGAETVTIAEDASLPAIVDQAVAVKSAFGRIDILLNNVGIDPLTATTVVDTVLEQWDAIMATGGGGAILTQARSRGLKPGVDEAAYSVSKAALVQLTRSVAIDHAVRDIRSNCLWPGYLEAVMSDRRATTDRRPRCSLGTRRRHRAAASRRPLRRDRPIGALPRRSGPVGLYDRCCPADRRELATRMTKAAINHVGLNVPDLAQATRFLVDASAAPLLRADGPG